ncbi:DUF6484 domain-containing protein [Citrobacter freundii]|uniref:DUF6484 domain-containing protein n=1 Tax=Citrobacter freundii TaxID=546 RepID=UPI001B38A75C|nr:DUF6484 domain-containing protein [Citrobacter freundii]EKU4668154.1 hypothetical protein [Citrobacter freundii]EKX5205236.1 hypothetical protein [Citrobacter freundii]MBQ0243874.1 hypothetical protein [Citrobacter freundii]MDT7422405.1 DUF6484 domain-containing protein [Citrobacter freundii]
MHSDASVLPLVEDNDRPTELLDKILESDGAHPPVNPYHMLIGRIIAVDDTGTSVAFSNTTSKALSVCPLERKDIERLCAIQFIQGDLSKPLIMGLIHTQTSAGPGEIPKTSEVSVRRNGKQVVIQADDELVLQCGESCIVMTAEGTVYIRALYIDSHALATQRLRGGSVQVN